MGMDANPEKDVTGVFAVEAHYKNGTVPGTSKPYSCDFDKLIMTKDAVIATIEMPGSAVRNMYLTFSLLGQSFTPLFCIIFSMINFSGILPIRESPDILIRIVLTL
jgi:hypothetical protein